MKISLFKKIMLSLMLILLVVIGSLAVVYFFFPQLLGEVIASRYTLPEEQSEQISQAMLEAYENSNIEYDEMEYILNQITPSMVMDGFAHFGDDPINRSELISYLGGQVDLGAVTQEELNLFTKPLLPDTLPPIDVLFDGYTVSEQMVAILLPVVKNEILRHLETGVENSGAVDLFSVEAVEPENIPPQDFAISQQEEKPAQSYSGDYSEEAIREDVAKFVSKEEIIAALRAPTDDQVYEVLLQVIEDDFIEYEEFLLYAEELFPEQEEELLRYAYDTLATIESQDQSLSTFADTFSSFPPFQQKGMIKMIRPILIQYVESSF